MVMTTKPQLKGLIVRSLTIASDDIEMAGRSEGCRTTAVSSRPQGEISSFPAEVRW